MNAGFDEGGKRSPLTKGALANLRYSAAKVKPLHPHLCALPVKKAAAPGRGKKVPTPPPSPPLPPGGGGDGGIAAGIAAQRPAAFAHVWHVAHHEPTRGGPGMACAGAAAGGQGLGRGLGLVGLAVRLGRTSS
jgi:hypothetical protein